MKLHNEVVVHVFNPEGTDFEVVLVQKNRQYVTYSFGTHAAQRAAQRVMIHNPEFLDRRFAPLWCSSTGEYVTTKTALENLGKI